MSLHEYRSSQVISASDPPFYALIMSAMRQADTHNVLKLQEAFPSVWAEFLLRFHARGGRIRGDQPMEEKVELSSRSHQ